MLGSAILASGCYHYAFEQGGAEHSTVPEAATGRDGDAREGTVTYEERVPTYLNGFVGTGTMDTTHYCREPRRTELRVTAPDVLVSIATLLVYTPHTLYVTCDLARSSMARTPAPGSRGR